MAGSHPRDAVARRRLAITIRDVASGRVEASTDLPDGALLTASSDGAHVAIGAYGGTWLWTPGHTAVQVAGAGGPSGFTADGSRVAAMDEQHCYLQDGASTLAIELRTGAVK